jgi:hypothetical protein
MLVKRKASLEQRLGQCVERRVSAETDRSGPRKREEDAESSSCLPIGRTRSSETDGAAARATEMEEGAWQRNRRRGGGVAQRGVGQVAAHSDGGDMATGKASCSSLCLSLWAH